MNWDKGHKKIAWMLSESCGGEGRGEWGDQTNVAQVERTPVEVSPRIDQKAEQAAARKRGRNVTMSSQMHPVFTSLK